MTIKKEFTFFSAMDQLEISCIALLPEKEYVGIIQFVHGMAEHKERYLDVMEYMANAGYLCVIHDHRGHGKSVKKQEDLGYINGKHADYMIEDIYQLGQYVKQKYPTLPFFLFGHSMGSLLVRAFCKRYDHEIDALIVCGSPSKNAAASAGKMVAQWMSKIKGEHYRSALIQHMAFGKHNNGFKETMSDNVWLCSDMNVVKAYDADPLCGFVFTLNGFENLFDLMVDVYDPKGWQMKHTSLPIRFIAGSNDPCIMSETKFKEAAGFMKTCGYMNVSARLFEGKRHEILNEDNKTEVYQDILNFYEKVRNEM